MLTVENVNLKIGIRKIMRLRISRLRLLHFFSNHLRKNSEGLKNEKKVRSNKKKKKKTQHVFEQSHLHWIIFRLRIHIGSLTVKTGRRKVLYPSAQVWRWSKKPSCTGKEHRTWWWSLSQGPEERVWLHFAPAACPPCPSLQAPAWDSVISSQFLALF